MFTGLIEKVCTTKSVRQGSDSMQISIDLENLAQEAKIGDSVAVNGVCLTVTKLTNSIAQFDISSETLKKSNLANLRSASQVNIELAMKPTDRFGGHFVQGHIDGTAKVEKIEKQGQFWNITFSADSDLLTQMVSKGSVAVNGISLTIANVNKSSFTTAIIPETLRNTALSKVKVADIVNIETDIITKTIKKQLENILPQKEDLTIEKLKDLGF